MGSEIGHNASEYENFNWDYLFIIWFELWFAEKVIISSKLSLNDEINLVITTGQSDTVLQPIAEKNQQLVNLT